MATALTGGSNRATPNRLISWPTGPASFASAAPLDAAAWPAYDRQIAGQPELALYTHSWFDSHRCSGYSILSVAFPISADKVTINYRLELLRYTWLKTGLKLRFFQPVLMLMPLTLIFFVVAILPALVPALRQMKPGC